MTQDHQEISVTSVTELCEMKEIFSLLFIGYGPVKNTRNSSTSRILSANHTMAKSPIATASVEPSRALEQDSFSE